MADTDRDRTLALCDLLLGAAHADAHFHDRERDAVRKLLGELVGGGKLPAEVEARIAGFDPSAFTVAKAAVPFRADPEADRRKLLHLVAAVHEADEELDFAEDDFLRELAAALELPADAIAGLAIEVESEELKKDFKSVRLGPPPIPLAGGSVDIDLDE